MTVRPSANPRMPPRTIAVIVTRMTQPVGGRDAAFQTIVWPTDGSALAETAVPTLEALARRHASKIIVFHVSRASSGEDERLESVRRRVGALELHGFAVELVVRDRGHDDPAHEIAALADETGADVIVLATHGRGTV